MSRGRTWLAQGHRVVSETHIVVSGRVFRSGPDGSRVQVSLSSHACRGRGRRCRRWGCACPSGGRPEWSAQPLASRAPRRLRFSTCIPRAVVLCFHLPRPLASVAARGPLTVRSPTPQRSPVCCCEAHSRVVGRGDGPSCRSEAGDARTFCIAVSVRGRLCLSWRSHCRTHSPCFCGMAVAAFATSALVAGGCATPALHGRHGFRDPLSRRHVVKHRCFVAGTFREVSGA